MTAATTQTLTIASTDPDETSKNLKTVKIVATEPHSITQNEAKKMSSTRKQTITIASTEPSTRPDENPKQQQQQQDENDSTPLSCIDIACEAIVSVFRSIGAKDEKQTDLAITASPMKAPVKKKLIIVTDYTEEKPNEGGVSVEKIERFVEELSRNSPPDATAREFSIDVPVNPKAPDENAPAMCIEQKISEKDKETSAKKQDKNTKKKSSTKKKVKALIGIFSKKIKKSKKSTIAGSTQAGTVSQPESTKMVQEESGHNLTGPISQPVLTKVAVTVTPLESTEEVIDKAEDALIDPNSSIEQRESTEVVQKKGDTVTEPISKYEPVKEGSIKADITPSETVFQPEFAMEQAEIMPIMPIMPTPQSEATKRMPKSVSFAELPEKPEPPSPTSIASEFLFDFIDTVSFKLDLPPTVTNANLAAARIVPLPDSDSDSDVDTENDSEVESIGETSNTFDVVKDMTEMWEKKDLLMNELNEMWEESDQDLVKVITEHISFDKDDDDEPLESDYMLARYKSFQLQPQMIVAA
ncbi:MAG: hypothetical protein SGBAC_006765 [Bacillariaceae sp.]